jgi:toxin CcdB
MAQFILYSNTNHATKAIYPYLLDVQSPILDSLDTRLVIPLALTSRFKDKVIKNLTPELSIKGHDYLVLTPQMAAINKKSLGVFIMDLSNSRNTIISAIDFLITGF